MNLAVRDIRHNLGRFILTSVGLGLLLMVVMGMGGIYRGLIEDATLLIDQVGADLWVVQRDTRGPFAERSGVPWSLEDRVAAVPGVAGARAFTYHTIQRDHHGTPLRIGIVGLSWPEDRGRWLSLAAGRPLGQAHYELVADRTLGLALGERLTLGKNTYTVVGIAEGMVGSGGDGLAFVSVRDALAIQFDEPPEAIRLARAARRQRGEASEVGQTMPALLDRAEAPAAELPALAPPPVSAVIARLAPGTDAEAVRMHMTAWDDVTVYSQQDQRDLMLQGAVQKAKAQIGLFQVLLTAIGAVVMALILYTLTLDKLREIALLKLIGAPNRWILGLILQQALALGAVGYGVAYLIGSEVFPRFPRRVIITAADLMQLAAVVALIAVGSSLLGIWRAMRVSPNEALSG